MPHAFQLYFCKLFLSHHPAISTPEAAPKILRTKCYSLQIYYITYNHPFVELLQNSKMKIIQHDNSQ